jgi:membrane protein involved in colicin uptake
MENMRAFTFGIVFIVLTACSDKAQPDYAKCVQADTTGDLAGAVKACSDAIGADPNSTSGKAAATKLAEIKPKYDAWKADQDAKAAAAAEAKRAADAVQAKAQAEARAVQAKAEAEARQAAVTDLRRRVKGLFAYDNKPDSRCLAEGKPPTPGTMRAGPTTRMNRLRSPTGASTSSANTWLPFAERQQLLLPEVEERRPTTKATAAKPRLSLIK